MEKMVNFKKFEVSGVTKEEAFAQTPFTANTEYWKNATQKYNNWKKKQNGVITDNAVKMFMAEYLKENKVAPGVGVYIVIESAVVNTKQKPYAIENVKREGPRETAKVFQLIDPETNRILAETKAKKVEVVDKETGEKALKEDGTVKMRWSCATQRDAEDLGRKLYENGYVGNIDIREVKKVVVGNQTVSRMTYAPSKNAKNGLYLVFGQEA